MNELGFFQIFFLSLVTPSPNRIFLKYGLIPSQTDQMFWKVYVYEKRFWEYEHGITTASLTVLRQQIQL